MSEHFDVAKDSGEKDKNPNGTNEQNPGRRGSTSNNSDKRTLIETLCSDQNVGKKRQKQVRGRRTQESDSSDSDLSTTEVETKRYRGREMEREERGRKVEQGSSRRKKGFGDLFRYFQRSLSESNEVEKAFDMARSMIECWKSNKYMYNDLEEMYLVNMNHNQDKEMLAKELGKSLGNEREKSLDGITYKRLVELTIGFFSTEQSVQDKLENGSKRLEMLQSKKQGRMTKRSRSRSSSVENGRPLQKLSKADSLKPIASYLSSLLLTHGVGRSKTKVVVADMIDRLDTGGYGWDRVILCHAKGEERFGRKLIPYIFMSKDDLPESLSPDKILSKVYEFIEEWKSQLFNMISTSTQVQRQPGPDLPSYLLDQDNKPYGCSSRILKEEMEMSQAKYRRKEYSNENSRTEVRMDEGKYSTEKINPNERDIKYHRAQSSSPSSERDENIGKDRDDQRDKLSSVAGKPRDHATTSKDGRISENKTKGMKGRVKQREHSPNSEESDCQSNRSKIQSVQKQFEINVPLVECKTFEINNEVKDVSPSNFENLNSKTDVEDIKVRQKKSLLEKVNEIIKSCVKLKDENKVTGSKLEKANQIIQKAEEKKLTLTDKVENESETLAFEDQPYQTLMERGDEKLNATKSDLEEGEITDDEFEEEILPTPNENLQGKRRQEAHQISNKSLILDELQSMAGQGIKKTKEIMKSPPPSSRSWSRSYRPRSQSPRIQHYHHHQYRQRSNSRSPSPPTRGQSQWIPVTPCCIQEDVQVERMSYQMVTIKAKGEFSFRDNPGCMVKITKWTGKDSVSNIHVRPQIVSLTDRSSVSIEIANTYQEETISLLKYDKIACLSILSAPIPARMFSSLSCSPDRLQTGERKWFKVTTVVLHKKGSLDRITIQPGKTLKVIGTVIGPLKKHVGKEVLISELDGAEQFPIQSQVTRICDNEKIGFNVTNRGRSTLVIEKCAQAIACVSVWATIRIEETGQQ